MNAVHVIAVNSGRLWREGLARLLEGTEFLVHQDPETALGDAPLLLGARGRIIILYRERWFHEGNAGWICHMRERAPSALIVIVTAEPRLSAFRQAIDAGADGYLTDDVCGRTFVRMLALLLDGERVISSALADLVTKPVHAVTAGPDRSDLSALSDGEIDILRRVARGQSNKQIANALVLTESTIKGRVKVLLQKISVSNRTQAAIWAVNHGLADSAHALPPQRSRSSIALSA
jgi:two-component system nitrate/nitrite response regulator NarL